MSETRKWTPEKSAEELLAEIIGEPEKHEGDKKINLNDKLAKREKILATGLELNKKLKMLEKARTAIEESKKKGVAPEVIKSQEEKLAKLNSLLENPDQKISENREEMNMLESEPEVINALHEEAASENKERFPLEAYEKEIKEAKKRVDEILQGITDLWKEDAGWALILAREQDVGKGWGREQELLNKKLEGKKQELVKINTELSKAWLKGKLQRNKTAAEEEVEKIKNELTDGNRKVNEVQDSQNKLVKELKNALKKFMEAVRARNRQAGERGMLSENDIVSENYPFIEYSGWGEEADYEIKNYIDLFEKFGYVRSLENTQE